MSFFGGRSAPAAMAGRGLGGAPFYATAGSTGVDFGTVRDQQAVPAAPTFQPFKFEPKRARIDWRLLHGIDIHAMVRAGDGLDAESRHACTTRCVHAQPTSTRPSPGRKGS